MKMPAAPQKTIDGAAKTVTARRVLVVDDNRDAAESLAVFLQLSGHTVHTAYDGIEGVAAAETFRPDIVLLDIGMPNLNGYEACRRIRATPWGKNMTVIAQTGNIYAGLYYPITIASITFIVGSLLLKETHSRLIWQDTEQDKT